MSSKKRKKKNIEKKCANKEKMIRKKNKVQYKTVITLEKCRKCGKWDRTLIWIKGIKPPMCMCKKPDTKYNNVIKIKNGFTSLVL